MIRPSIFAGMGAAFTAALGNVDAVVTVAGVVRPSIRGIFRGVRETDLLEIDGMGAEGVKYVFSAEGPALDGIRRNDTVTIGAVTYDIVGHIDDGRAMKRLYLHESETP